MKIKKLISVIILVVSIILNIVLLSTDIFKGTYTAKTSTEKLSLRFYDNTFTLIGEDDTYSLYTYGFSQYVKKSKYKNSPTNVKLNYDAVILHRANASSSGSSSYLRFDKKNIFCLSYKEGYLSAQSVKNFYCYPAIFLQVLYIVLIISSTSYLVYQYKKAKLLKKN